MASSRAASREASPEPLTPRAKIRALLATVGSSDDEGGAGVRGPLTRQRNGSAVEDEGDSSQSDVAVRPRGKLASRMRAAAAADKDVQGGRGAQKSARERVKEMLALEAAAKAVDEESKDQDDGESDLDLPVAPRRLKRRAPEEPASGAAARSPSPGLFVSSPMRPSPAKSAPGNHEGSDSDSLPSLKSDRFRALVERKRQERLAREAAEEARRAEQRARQEKLASELEQLDSDDGNVSSITDDEGGRRLTQGARSTRKASKKAIEEMNRETQRMARSMQLAHEAKTRKTMTKASLFERFNFRPAGDGPEPKTASSSRPPTPATDVEMRDADTPPSSPPTAKGQALQQAAEPGADVVMGEAEALGGGAADELPDLDATLNPAQAPDKGKGKAPAAAPEDGSAAKKPMRRVRVRLPIMTANMATINLDDELEVTETKRDKIKAVLDSIPANKAQESRSMKALRALALVRSPGKGSGRGSKDPSSMTPGELQTLLYQRSRAQAKLERERRLQALKAQGVVIQTADERERQQQEVEDLVAKAREEAQKIMQEERAAAKKERKESGSADPLAWDDSEDEEHEGSADEADGKASALELSGSDDDEDDEEEGDEGDDAAEDDGNAAGPALCDEGGEPGDSEPEQRPEEEEEDEADEDELPVTKQRRARKQTAILSDDEAEPAVRATPRPVRVAAHTTPGAVKTTSPGAPNSVLRSAKKTFIPGLPVQGPAGLGLTQMFAGTMDDSQTKLLGAPTQTVMPDIDDLPDSHFSATVDDEDVVVDSQGGAGATQTQGVQLNLSQSQMRNLDSLLAAGLGTQMSETMEASQDGGLQQHTPIKQRFIDAAPSTAGTAAAGGLDDEDAPHESPLVRRGRLRRRGSAAAADEARRPPVKAFEAMAEAARREARSSRAAVAAFDRKKTRAKEMVEEQAEESEDEYAGLGGADGDDSDNESQGSLQDMVDDDDAADVDGSKLAAFYA